MVEMGNPARYSAANDLFRESKQLAAVLRQRAVQVARSLFEQGDLREFLRLVSKLHYYDAHNLLLILQQYPKATYLAGFKVWQKQFNDPKAQVLKPEWRGKGIDLIAPYTEDIGNGRYGLTWYSIKHFDISQTNLRGIAPPPSVYVVDELHLSMLQDSITEVIATEYHRTVIHNASSPQLRAAGLTGQMNDSMILIRDDVKISLRLYFLCECLCQLAIQSLDPLTAPQLDLAYQCIIYCLFEIWNIPQPKQINQNPTILHSISKASQISFLSLIQRVVRSLDESISSSYKKARTGEKFDL